MQGKGRVERVLSRLCNLVVKRPLWLLAGSFVLAAASLFYSGEHLTFWTERNVLLSQDTLPARLYHAYRQEFPDDYLILVVSSEDLDRAKAFASLLGQRLEADPVPVREVFYRIPSELFRRQALLFLDTEDIETLRTKITKHRELLERLAASPDLVTLLETMNTQISKALVRTAVSGLFGEEEPEEETGKQEKKRVDPEDLKVLSAVMESLAASIRSGAFRSPWKVFFGGERSLSEDGYLVDEDRGWVFLFAYLREVETSFNREGAAIERIRGHIQAVSEEISGVSVGITGTPALNSEEMSVSLRDMTQASILALVLVTVLFVVGFGHAVRPLLAVVALAVGVVLTLGWLSLTVGHLTILSMAFGSILIGLGIDFGIHFVARYEAELGRGRSVREALEETYRRVGRPVLSSGLTTMAAFLSMALAEFRGLREFGWIAGWGVFFCLVSALVVLPALLLLKERLHIWRPDVPPRTGNGRPSLLERILEKPSRHPGWVFTLSGLAALLVFLPVGPIRFDYNLLNLQARGTEAVDWELRLVEAQGNSSIFAADMVNSLEEARKRGRQYESLPSVQSVESLATYLPENPEERMERVRSLGPLLEGLTVSGTDLSAPDPAQVERWLSRIRFKLREEEEKETHGSKEPGTLRAPDTVSGARYRTEEVLRSLEAAKASGDLASRLASCQERLATDFRRKLDILRSSALDPVPITVEGLPDFIRKRYLGRGGKWLLQIYGKEDVWQTEPQRRFVDELRTVNPEVTGPAVLNYESTRSLLEAYLEGGLYASIAIAAILLLDFRSVRLASLSLVPLGLGWLWTLGGMRLLHLSFNPANLVIIPLLVGIGVDNGIHIVRHFLQSPSAEGRIAGSRLGRAILLSSLTTMAGFGSLLVAHHQGIRSIGSLLSLAVGSCLVAALVFLPTLLRVLAERRTIAR